MAFSRRREGGACCDSHRSHDEDCTCYECNLCTNGNILKITWGAVTHTEPYFHDFAEFGKRVRQCLDSRLVQSRLDFLPGRHPYKMSGNIRHDPIDSAVLYTICIVFREDPGWARLWEKVTHTATGECLLPIHPKTIWFDNVSILPSKQSA